MGNLIRKQFYISHRQETLLKKKAAELGLTEAEIVREALDSQLSKMYIPRTPNQVWAEERKYIEDRVNERGTRERSCRTWKRDDLHDR